MSQHQRVEQVPGQQLWVETWSWCESMSPCAPLIYTSLGGEVNVWKVKPKERKPMPQAAKVLCAIPGVYFVWWVVGFLRKASMERHRYKGEVMIRVRNSYRDRAGQEVVPRTNVRASRNPYIQEEWAVSLFFPRYPHLGGKSTPVVSIETEAEVFIGAHPFHHATWAGSTKSSGEAREA